VAEEGAGAAVGATVVDSAFGGRAGARSHHTISTALKINDTNASGRQIAGEAETADGEFFFMEQKF
jgi:hypothetical protein